MIRPQLHLFFALALAVLSASGPAPALASSITSVACERAVVAVDHIEHKNGKLPGPELFHGQRTEEIPVAVADRIATRIQGLEASLRLEHDALFALNYTANREQIEIVSSGLDDVQVRRLSDEVRRRKLINELETLPTGLRNKYFLIPLSPHALRHRAPIRYVFAWETGLRFKSHLMTGFAETSTAFVEPLTTYKPSPQASIRTDLINEGRAQETGATCGIAGICQVLNSRGVDISEWALLEHAASVRPVIDIVAHANPGLSIRQLVLVGHDFTARHPRGEQFTFELHSHLQPSQIGEFRHAVSRASHRETNTDIVVNLYSPLIGRPGTGHFLPIAGYDPQTDFVLMSETNKAVNGSYWISLPQLYKAMLPSESGERGYIVMSHQSN